MATTNMAATAATTTDSYGDNSYQTLWMILAHYFKLKMLRIISLKIYPLTLMIAKKF
jgi:hypothetical protein